MAIICNVCGYDKNPDGAEFCDACGAELPQAASAPPPTTPPISISTTLPIATPTTPPISTPLTPPTATPTTPPTATPTTPPTATPTTPPTATPTTPPIATPTTPPISTPTLAGNAKIIAKQANAPIPEFEIKGTAVIGIFDPDMGPVDIDLEQFQGGETVSRNHAEIYQEGGVWKIKDFGSSNGIFIKPAGQTRFNARITTPVQLNSGDEIAIAKVIFLFQSS